jgi:hypothetical protein
MFGTSRLASFPARTQPGGAKMARVNHHGRVVGADLQRFSICLHDGTTVDFFRTTTGQYRAKSRGARRNLFTEVISAAPMYLEASQHYSLGSTLQDLATLFSEYV